MTYRILVTGSRRWTDREVIRDAVFHAAQGRTDIVVVHGAADGADRMAHQAALEFGYLPEIHPAHHHVSPKHRNDYMVQQGADVCLAFAQTWASGTGHCARLARAREIPVIDYGVDTRREARPA